MKQSVLYKCVLFAILCLAVLGIKSENTMRSVNCATYCGAQQHQPGKADESTMKYYFHNDGFLIRI
jgi:hypothetical protein